MMNEDLNKLGDALELTVANDIQPKSKRVAKPKRRRRAILGVAAMLVVLPGAAIAANSLISTDQVASSIPAGTFALAGTHPKCEVVEEGVEFTCALTNPPGNEPAVGASWMGTVEPTVDADKRINGGCRSEDPDGMTWRCYIGEEAVAQKIVSRELLGEYSPRPGVG